jgi:hypothetical protein
LMLKSFKKFVNRDIFQERRGGTIKGWAASPYKCNRQ